jgi:hypothetical protein
VLTQRIQRIAQAGVIAPALAGADQPDRELRAPRALHVIRRFPALQALPAYLIGRGVRPEHIHAQW